MVKSYTEIHRDFFDLLSVDRVSQNPNLQTFLLFVLKIEFAIEFAIEIELALEIILALEIVLDLALFLK